MEKTNTNIAQQVARVASEVFTTGTMVQVFLLAAGVADGTWSGNGSVTHI